MSTVLIGYNNLIDTSTLSGTGWNASYPITNLQDRALAVVARSTSATVVYIDHGSAKAARLAWVAAHSYESPSDSFTLNRGTTLGGSDVYAGSPLPAWPFTPRIGTRDGAVYGVPLVMSSENTARYTTIIIPAGEQIGRIFVGPAFDPTYRPTELTDDWQAPNSMISRTPSGADWVHQRPELRSVGLVYGAMPYADAALLDEIMMTHSITGEVVYIPDANDRELSQRRGFLGTLRSLSKLEYPFWQHNGTAVAIDERGGAP